MPCAPNLWTRRPVVPAGTDEPDSSRPLREWGFP